MSRKLPVDTVYVTIAVWFLGNTETHCRCEFDQRGKGLMGKQSNFPIGILRIFFIFLFYYHLLISIWILKGCLVYWQLSCLYKKKAMTFFKNFYWKKATYIWMPAQTANKAFLRRLCIKNLSFYCLGSTSFVINFATLHEWSSRYVRISRRWATSS